MCRRTFKPKWSVSVFWGRNSKLGPQLNPWKLFFQAKSFVLKFRNRFNRYFGSLKFWPVLVIQKTLVRRVLALEHFWAIMNVTATKTLESCHQPETCVWPVQVLDLIFKILPIWAPNRSSINAPATIRQFWTKTVFLVNVCQTSIKSTKSKIFAFLVLAVI